jgi:hypothetical protein
LAKEEKGMGFHDFTMRDYKKTASERMEQNQRIMEGCQVSDSGGSPVSKKLLFGILGAVAVAIIAIVVVIIVLR